MVQELTYGEDAQPSTQEILSSMQQFVLALKKGIAQDLMAALSKEAAELLAAEVVDEKRYREVMEEMRHFNEVGGLGCGDNSPKIEHKKKASRPALNVFTTE